MTSHSSRKKDRPSEHQRGLDHADTFVQPMQSMRRSKADKMPPLSLLIVEDDDQYFTYLKILLRHSREPGFTVTRVASLEQACRWLQYKTPAVILVDLNLPDSRGLSTLQEIKRLARDIPTVVLTGCDNTEIGLTAVSGGAQDYLVKQNIGAESLLRCLHYAIERQRAEQARLRLSAIEDFTATLAHDLQTPLIGSNNVLSLLLEGELGTLSAQQRDVLTELKQSTQQQLSLVKRLLDIYHFESGDRLTKAQIDLTQVLMRSVESFRKTTGSSCTIELNIQSQLPLVYGDEAALRQVFLDLIDNAVRFGQVGKPISISAQSCEDVIAIRVHNYGAPISKEVQDLLFGQFWHGVAGKSYVTNTGMGLYLCHRIAAQHGGRIRCRSTEELGTEFTVIFPISNQ